MRTDRRTALLAGLAGAASVGLGVLAAPRPPVLSGAVTGDRSLAAALRRAVDPAGHRALAAALVTPDGVRFAGLGAGERTEFEIGSVTKTFTALLLAQALRRGDFRLATPVGDLLDLGRAPVATATLEQLVTHSSGLPRLGRGTALAGVVSGLTAGDPYSADLAALLGEAREASTDGRGRFRYSNLGAALLGQALAADAGTAYRALLAERVLRPLGLTRTRFPTTAAGARTGWSESGRAEAAWTMGAYAPAGALRSTAEDMGSVVRALLVGDPRLGVDVDLLLAPRRPTDERGRRIGLAWFTEVRGGRAVTWHDGGTGGFSSMIAMDRAAGTGVVLLGDTSASVARPALALLEEAT